MAAVSFTPILLMSSVLLLFEEGGRFERDGGGRGTTTGNASMGTVQAGQVQPEDRVQFTAAGKPRCCIL